MEVIRQSTEDVMEVDAPEPAGPPSIATGDAYDFTFSDEEGGYRESTPCILLGMGLAMAQGSSAGARPGSGKGTGGSSGSRKRRMHSGTQEETPAQQAQRKRANSSQEDATALAIDRVDTFSSKPYGGTDSGINNGRALSSKGSKSKTTQQGAIPTTDYACDEMSPRLNSGTSNKNGATITGYLGRSKGDNRSKSFKNENSIDPSKDEKSSKPARGAKISERAKAAKFGKPSQDDILSKAVKNDNSCEPIKDARSKKQSRSSKSGASSPDDTQSKDNTLRETPKNDLPFKDDTSPKKNKLPRIDKFPNGEKFPEHDAIPKDDASAKPDKSGTYIMSNAASKDHKPCICNELGKKGKSDKVDKSGKGGVSDNLPKDSHTCQELRTLAEVGGRGSTLRSSSLSRKKMLSFSQPLSSSSKPPLAPSAIKSWSQPDALLTSCLPGSGQLLCSSQPPEFTSMGLPLEEDIPQPRRARSGGNDGGRSSIAAWQHPRVGFNLGCNIEHSADTPSGVENRGVNIDTSISGNNAHTAGAGSRCSSAKTEVAAAGAELTSQLTPVKRERPEPTAMLAELLSPGGLLSPASLELSPASHRSLKRNLLLRKLALALGPLAAQGGVVGVATTVTQAQERGELQRMQDDALFALDGLTPSNSSATQGESAATLAEKLATPRGRMALRSDGLAQQALTAMAKLRGARDPVLALAASLMLFSLSQLDAHPSYMSSLAVAALMDQLLQVSHSYPRQASTTNSTLQRVLSLTVDSPLARQLPLKRGLSHRSFVLMALVLATTPPDQEGPRMQFVPRLKANLQRFGILDRLAALTMQYFEDSLSEVESKPNELANSIPEDPYLPPCSPPTDTPLEPQSEVVKPESGSEHVAGPLWHLHLCLLVLENATFTCPANEIHTLRTTLEGTGQSGRRQHFVAAMVSSVNSLIRSRELWYPGVRDCVHACLAVLMNLTHQNQEGAERVTNAGALELAVQILQSCCTPVHSEDLAIKERASQEKARPSAASQTGKVKTGVFCCQLRSLVLQRLDLVTVCLGLLINLAASSRDNREKILQGAGGQLVVQDDCSHPSSQKSSGRNDGKKRGSSGQAASCSDAAQGLLGLLCCVMDSMAPLEVTEKQQQANDSEAEASIVEAYTAMLLGFLMQDNPDVRHTCAQSLSAKSIDPVVQVVQRCLGFYVSTGAIADVSRGMLQELVQSLQAAGAD